ncbi:hypothetical protein Acor_54860 [Acrocarpospora corrugata]|uniref:Methyltransferase FkbM domain-containing protein n=1 Tax=Acrocarpospora corrugata TaxID=35763 RepID=A0A5M3W588_9ACTN|nr:FkbM family methyltransferase [Acrocarpospora corrugata]GES03420.1 hypothetical protein Acor_54860 [Acrocarpospora corrugata]
MIPYTQPPPFHAQWGEDRWLAEHANLPERGVFVDVGAGDGVRGSNTLYWERRGWTGLCVDADPRNQQSLAGRTCRTASCAVASQPGPRTFSMYGPRPSLSGLAVAGPDYRPITVECRPLAALLADAGIGKIDLLSIDVEGTELDVWDSFDHHRHHSRIVIIEYSEEQRGRNAAEIKRHLGPRYEQIHRTPSNLILRSRE